MEKTPLNTQKPRIMRINSGRDSDVSVDCEEVKVPSNARKSSERNSIDKDQYENKIRLGCVKKHNSFKVKTLSPLRNM